mgnify:FL=1
MTASGTEPLTYRWQRNGVDIPGATASSYTIASATLADSGTTFRCIVSNVDGSATSDAATLTVVANTAPSATITSPLAGTTYRAGDTISFSGSATDVQDGTLGGDRFAWEVVFHHADHTHPYLSGITGTTGSFNIANTGETATDVWYELRLTVTDSGGLTTTATRRLDPRLVTLTLASSPTGLQLTVDGVPCVAPCTFGSVVGMQRTIGATTPQTFGGTTYAFSAWSDRGKVTHTITAPATNTTYSATFKVAKRV